ncbi:MAG: FAD-dependent oxidoreductase [Clostridia bacterium]|nr:FAD-dependent oxidoreductase [Clostridia bacterium]
MREFDLAIIGSGVGLSLAEAALNKGLRCALVEEGKFGGTCLTRGCIPSKILVHPADLIREAAHAARIGLDFQLAGMDWGVLSRRMWEKIGESARIEHSLTGIQGLTVYKGRGAFTAPFAMRVTTPDGGTVGEFRARRYILAPGARSAVPPVDGLEQVGYVVSETFFGDRFPEKPWKSLVILGGGAIGCEFAHIFSAFGTRVTVVERLPRLASTEEEEVSRLVESQFRANGIDVLTGHRAVRVRGTGAGKTVTVRDEATGATRDIHCEEILVSAGVRSNADRIAADAAGIALDERGWIRTDEYLQTSVPGIWALGDINGKYQFRHKANYEADILAGNLFGPGGEAGRRQVHYDAVPWAIFTCPQVAHVGLTEAQARERGGRLLVGYNRYSSVAKGFAMGYEPGDPDDGFVKLIADEHMRILGVHIAGPHASMLIQPFVYLMNAGFSCTLPSPAERGKVLRRKLSEAVHQCLEAGTISPIYESMVIHPALSEVAAWVIGGLRFVNEP